MAVSECVYGVGRFVYSLFGMGMQRVDAAAYGVRRALIPLTNSGNEPLGP